MVAAPSLFPLQAPRAEDERLLELFCLERGLGICEVWVFEAGTFRILTLRGDHDEAIPGSEVLPEAELSRIAHFAGQADQHAVLRAFRAELHGTL